ncbi:MAG TPA: hypothetical protein VFG83_08850, partial [Kofleriaceae bacterium]|nr:hypothetical protein [Kofleriaceae bacterium]
HDHVVNILNLQSPGNEQIWLGFSDLACGNNEFISVTGAAVTIPDISDEGWGWDNGEPSNGGKKSNTDDGAENCVVLRENGPTAGGWNDAPCVAEKHTFFCECDGDRPDPRFFSAPDKGGVCPLD